MSKWITFVKYAAGAGKKTDSYRIQNKEDGSHLGWIKWYGPWRQYAFFPEQNCVFEKTCLKDITDFLVELMEERKKQKQS
jgi:hypothetical protein